MFKNMVVNKKMLPPIMGAVLLFVLAICLLLPGGASAYGEITQEQTGPAPVGLARATFAAGCFWSMEAIFKQLKGVESVYPGYSGGTLPHPSYEVVETGLTGYAETVNVTYDPKVITYAQLLNVLLTVRNPTTLNQQGNDVGTQYRSIIFYRTDDEKRAAEAAVQSAAQIWHAPVVTEIMPFSAFYRAETYHLNYYALHPNEDYCTFVIAPEIAGFRAKFKSLLKS